MKSYWKGLVTTESKCGTIDFIHNKSLETIYISVYHNDIDKPDGLTLSYEEWEELIKLVKRIS